MWWSVGPFLTWSFPMNLVRNLCMAGSPSQRLTHALILSSFLHTSPDSSAALLHQLSYASTVSTSTSTVIFQVRLGQPVPPQFFSSTCCGKKPLWIRGGTGFPWTGCPSCLPANSVEAPKETKSNDADHWPGLVVSSLTTGRGTGPFIPALQPQYPTSPPALPHHCRFTGHKPGSVSKHGGWQTKITYDVLLSLSGSTVLRTAMKSSWRLVRR